MLTRVLVVHDGFLEGSEKPINIPKKDGLSRRAFVECFRGEGALGRLDGTGRFRTFLYAVVRKYLDPEKASTAVVSPRAIARSPT